MGRAGRRPLSRRAPLPRRPVAVSQPRGRVRPMTGRVPPLPPREWPAGVSESLTAAYRPSNPRHPVPPRDPSSPKGLNAMGVLAHHPELTDAYNQLIRHALYFTTLTPRERELLVLRVAHVRDAVYEWAQHVYQAGVAGLTAEEVTRVRQGPEAPG